MTQHKENGQQIVQSLAGDYEPGSYWTHFKGGVYQLVTLGVEENTGQVLVVYKSLKHGTVWVRTLDNFAGMTTRPDGNTYKRFTKGAP
jgi:hypothetical protein